MKRVIATVGPSLLHKVPISDVHKSNYIYRINGAHGSPADIEEYIHLIRKQVPDADILMDLPGNKVRSRGLETPIEFKANVPFKLLPENTNYSGFFGLLKKGQVLLANDSIYKFTIQEVSPETLTLVSEYPGILQNNKGLHVTGIHGALPFLFEKDLKLIEIANKFKLAFVGLSFVRNAADIEEAKKLIESSEIISKVETKSAVDNLNEILKIVDYILIDRGDLSTEVGMEKIPSVQKFIVDKCLFFNKKPFLATQFLKNMEEKPIATIAEVIDLYNTLKNGVYGIQLSEETAVGQFPGECLAVIERMQTQIQGEN